MGRSIPQAASTAIVGDDSDGVRLNGSTDEGVQVVMPDNIHDDIYDDIYDDNMMISMMTMLSLGVQHI